MKRKFEYDDRNHDDYVHHMFSLLALTTFSGCNPERDAFTSTSGGSATLIKLPQPKGEEATFPAALDGTPYAFYHAASPTKSTKWTININGGGWCYDEDDCLCRSYGSLGSSKAYAPTGGCACKNPLPDGTLDQTCNCIDMNYLDGASFSGYRAAPWPVPNSKNSSALLWFRGIKNLDATLDWAFANGMKVCACSQRFLSLVPRSLSRLTSLFTRRRSLVLFFFSHFYFVLSRHSNAILVFPLSSLTQSLQIKKCNVAFA